MRGLRFTVGVVSYDPSTHRKPDTPMSVRVFSLTGLRLIVHGDGQLPPLWQQLHIFSSAAVVVAPMGAAQVCIYIYIYIYRIYRYLSIAIYLCIGLTTNIFVCGRSRRSNGCRPGIPNAI